MNTRPESSDTSPELVVFRVRRDTRCAECEVELGRGQLLRLEDHRALCLECADLDHLEYLPRGDAALTRRARARSTLQAVVVEWSRSRQRYERQGVLVESAALAQAEQECLSDAEVRARQRERSAERRDAQDIAYIAAFASSIRDMFPQCPADEATRIAAHACKRNSGHVGRTSAARSFDPEAIRLAVGAHVRHVHTDYDRLLSQFGDRLLARDEVRDRVEQVMRDWQQS